MCGPIHKMNISVDRADKEMLNTIGSRAMFLFATQSCSQCLTFLSASGLGIHRIFQLKMYAPSSQAGKGSDSFFHIIQGLAHLTELSCQ